MAHRNLQEITNEGKPLWTGRIYTLSCQGMTEESECCTDVQDNLEGQVVGHECEHRIHEHCVDPTDVSSTRPRTELYACSAEKRRRHASGQLRYTGTLVAGRLRVSEIL